MVALVGGPAAVSLPELVAPNQSDGVRFLLACAALFTLGVVMGCLAPERPWRWAIGAILLLPGLDAYHGLAKPDNFRLDEFLAQLRATLPNAALYAFQGLLVLGGAYLGLYTSRRH